VPLDHEERPKIESVLARFGEPVESTRGVAVRLADDELGLADVVRALDAEGLEVADLNMHAPTLDDVFLEKTGRSLEGAGAEPQPEPVGA
jgi:ABC-2 type transport system ATP-binding protein